MRGVTIWAASIAAVVTLAGCGGEPATKPANDSLLVLEVGGEQPSLRAALLGLGRAVGVPRQLIERGRSPEQLPADPLLAPEGAEGLDGPEGSVDGPVDGGPVSGSVADPGPTTVPVSSPPIEAEWFVAELQEGETLIHVAREHLGDGRRFHELLRWNGWTESDARRLRTGQKVKIRASAMRESGGR